MATILSLSSPASGAKAGTTPLLCGPAPARYYRRSTTTKAPRKRTFLLTMTKYTVELATPPGVAAAFANNVAMLSGGSCFVANAALSSGDGSSGFGGNFGGNNKNNNGGNSNWGGSGSGNNGDSFEWRFAPSLGHAFLGALAIIAAVAVFPARSAAMQQGTSPSTSPSLSAAFLSNSSPKDAMLLSSSAPSSRISAGPLADVPTFGRTSSPSTGRPRSKVLHVPCKGSTLVVPLTGNDGDIKAAAPRLAPWQRAKIVDAPIVLSGNEAAVLDLPQYRVRESLLV